MARGTKLKFNFARQMKPRKKPEHVIADKFSANVEVVYDFPNEVAAQRIKLLEKELQKQGDGILDKYEKQIHEKIAALDELAAKQVKAAEKGASNAGKKATDELKKINKFVKTAQNEIGAEIRETLEKVVKKHKIKGKAMSVGRNLFRELKFQRDLFEGEDDGPDEKEVKEWTDIHKSWGRDAQVLSGGGSGGLDGEAAGRAKVLESLKILRNPNLDDDDRKTAVANAGKELKQYARDRAKYLQQLKKTIRQIDGNLSFIKKQKNEAEKGLNKQLTAKFDQLRKEAAEIEQNVEVGGDLASQLEPLLATAAGDGRAKVKKAVDSLQKGNIDNWKAVSRIEKLQGEINKLFRKATAKRR